MAHLIHQRKIDDKHNDAFLVILKVHCSGIHLRPYDDVSSMSKIQSFRILCRDIDSDHATSDIRVFVLAESSTTIDKCVFQYQQPTGQPIGPNDLATFMTPPVASAKKSSYAIDLGVCMRSTSMEDLSKDDYRKIGTAYLYLDPQFSSQGIQRMQIMGAQNLGPIGQLQIEYLVVKNPNAFGVRVPRPDWLARVAQLDAGHRGAGSGCRADLPGAITENTVASFNYAARHGADMCELDVMCTADGIPVVYHNYTLETGKPEVTQVDQLTLNELRDLKRITTHDQNCQHNLDNQNVTFQESNRPFPTLKEVLSDVDKSCALNIELKWPQLLPNGKSEATHYREINDFVDRILHCIDMHSNGRVIVLSTLNADIAIMLRLKQSQYPVLFLTTGDSQRFNDPTTKTIKNAIHFAQAFDMAGINPNAANLTEYLVRYAQDRGLLVYAWGKIESAQAIKELKRTGLNGVIYDKIDLIKPQD